jgi:PhzF family phenazine biosynthesis protein
MNFLLIDAFANQPFTGNPAAVVLLERPAPDHWLQSLAMEFNQAETAYVSPRTDGGFDLRWFTPLREVPLCGHATLAAARALKEWKLVDQGGVVRFITRQSGELRCSMFEDDQIAMDFPATPPAPAELPPETAKVLGVSGPVRCVGTTVMNLTLALPNLEQITSAKPDFRTLATWHPVGVTITAPGDAGVDFVSRFFAPAAGIDEDPVTGSAHCTLAVYWAGVLQKTDFVAHQLSRRGGRLSVSLLADRVALRGNALITARGTIDARF